MSGPANILTDLSIESQNPFWCPSSYLYIKQLKNVCWILPFLNAGFCCLSDTSTVGDIQDMIQDAGLLLGTYMSLFLDICYNILILFMKYQKKCSQCKRVDPGLIKTFML